MTTPQDVSIGFGVETTYGTNVTPTRWLEFTDESLDYDKNVKQGQGLRVGGRVDRSQRRTVPTANGGGDLTFEVVGKGLGLLWQACFGAGASTLVSGSLFQQVFTLADVPPSLTLQEGLPRSDGSIDATTYVGAMVDKLELTFPQADIVTAKATIDCKDVITGPAYTAPSYGTPLLPFHFAHGVIGSGNLTAPTATALAAADTPLANIRSGTLTLNNNLDKDRYNYGGGGRKSKPLVGKRQITGSLSAELLDSTFRNLVLSDSPMFLLWTFTNGTDVLQVVVPEVKLDGTLPKSNGGDTVMQDVNFTGLDNLAAAQPIWLVTRTSDSAL